MRPAFLHDSGAAPFDCGVDDAKGAITPVERPPAPPCFVFGFEFNDMAVRCGGRSTGVMAPFASSTPQSKGRSAIVQNTASSAASHFCEIPGRSGARRKAFFAACARPRSKRSAELTQDLFHVYVLNGSSFFEVRGPSSDEARKLSRKEREQQFPGCNLILDAAEEVFAETSFAAPLWRRLPRAPRRTLYNMFRSKEDVYRAVVSRTQDMFFDCMDEETVHLEKVRWCMRCWGTFSSTFTASRVPPLRIGDQPFSVGVAQQPARRGDASRA